MAGLSAQRLAGKVALITGGASGIGEAAARLFTRHGAKVIIADIQTDMNSSTADLGTSVDIVKCDVTNESDVAHAVDWAVKKYGKLDVMFNNAGITDDMKPSIVDSTVDDFLKVVRVNLLGPFLGTKHAARVMIPAKRGTIITTGSVCSVMGGSETYAYTSAKHGVLGLVRNAAVELGRYGIRVNCVSPSLLVTGLTRKQFGVDEESMKMVYSGLKGVVLRAEDVAEAALYLASDESRYVNGANLMVDGGFTVHNHAFLMPGWIDPEA